MATARFDGVKIFSATTANDRNELGTRITHWLGDHAGYEIVDKLVLQSSDEKFHCVTIVFFYVESR